ncbi:methylated-DNA--[protein]-cysteine S-methyltransferase [Williamsia sp. CHRR-6]|uniref:methylated-DNA--[protein]-cysteine S-methyltransferase n=1 Tax=Williamsia sp. CHRR-6 TaxID=2835871 RepID=UPI001BDB4D3B|nr:methylated-DNA--[protein]-cysteine S-methyltransferase [Williamsia sp. CHRR-6]MBT0565572.1 methylated-DNA--[protein]-cysteine S-methyltransferase [Williamsia sp. CHRR-6]
MATCATLTMATGEFTAIVDADDRVLASGWTADPDPLLELIHPDLRPSGVRTLPDLGAITRAVRAYDRGDVTAIDDISVHQRGGPFIEHAWTVLRTVAPGTPITYSEFAVRAGNDLAVRAAATACARNAAALFVPCHRIRRRDGGLGGFRYGLHIKQALIDHESSHGLAAA